MRKTLVHFRLMPTGMADGDNDVIAIFPQLNYYGKSYGRKDVKQSYQHIGQHGPCQASFIQTLEKAKPNEYQDLKKELEGLGYKLKICK